MGRGPSHCFSPFQRLLLGRSSDGLGVEGASWPDCRSRPNLVVLGGHEISIFRSFDRKTGACFVVIESFISIFIADSARVVDFFVSETRQCVSL